VSEGRSTNDTTGGQHHDETFIHSAGFEEMGTGRHRPDGSDIGRGRLYRNEAENHGVGEWLAGDRVRVNLKAMGGRRLLGDKRRLVGRMAGRPRRKAGYTVRSSRPRRGRWLEMAKCIRLREWWDRLRLTWCVRERSRSERRWDWFDLMSCARELGRDRACRRGTIGTAGESGIALSDDLAQWEGGGSRLRPL